MELINGELGRFTINIEGPQEMYNRIKSLVNQIQNYRSTKWTDHEVVKLMLRSLIPHNTTLVTLICEHPRYEEFKQEEILGKFLSHDMMVKDSKHVQNKAHRNTTTSEP
jgi:hypothetical protein